MISLPVLSYDAENTYSVIINCNIISLLQSSMVHLIIFGLVPSQNIMVWKYTEHGNNLIIRGSCLQSSMGHLMMTGRHQVEILCYLYIVMTDSKPKTTLNILFATIIKNLHKFIRVLILTLLSLTAENTKVHVLDRKSVV